MFASAKPPNVAGRNHRTTPRSTDWATSSAAEPHTEVTPSRCSSRDWSSATPTWALQPSCSLTAARTTRLYTVLVGESSKARKGTALARERLRDRDEEWVIATSSPASSSEGLIQSVRRHAGDGVADKRLMIVDSEFATTPARCAGWQYASARLAMLDGNALSAMTNILPGHERPSLLSATSPDELTKLLQQSDHYNDSPIG